MTRQVMNLYFTADQQIDSDVSIAFNKVAVEISKSFVDIIEFVSKQNSDNIVWWVSSPANKNTFINPLFHYCCCIALLQELIRSDVHFTEIITDSKAFKKILENCLAMQGVNACVSMTRLSVKQRIKDAIRPIYTTLEHLLLFFMARHTKPLRKTMPSEPLTLIDTFVMPGYIDKDRYYPGMLDALPEKEQRHVWFVPYLHEFSPWQCQQVINRLRKSQRNFILKYDFLKFKDYFYSWRQLLRVNRLNISNLVFQGVDISPLVREQLGRFCNLNSSYVPLLNYLFAKRLKETGVKLRLVIDWFENQDIDKGWNAGFRHFFPDVETIGYQGFIVSGHYLCMYPTVEEQKNKVIPHKVFVTGRGLMDLAKRFCPDLDVNVAPAFRFQHVWRERKYFPDGDVYKILVALPIVMSDAIYVLKSLLHTANEMTDSSRFWIKPHPSVPQDQIQREFGAVWPHQFEFISGDFGDCVEKSNLLISTASSVSMETIAKGIPVIIIGNNSGLTQNPIPETIISDIWRLCYTDEEIKQAITFYRNRGPEKIREHEVAGKKIRGEYFEPVTQKGVRAFLRL